MLDHHPYRGYVPAMCASSPAPPPDGDLRIGCAVLVAVSLIQLVTGTQIAVGALGAAAGLAGLLSTWRPRWTTPSSCS